MSSSKSKSVLVTAFGGYDVLEVKNHQLQELGIDDVAVNVYFCGVNFADLYTRLGLIPKANIPFILGIECSGIVTEIGKNVTKFKINDRVVCYDYQGGLYRDKIVLSGQKCYIIPDDISLKDACAIFVNYLTAYISVIEFGNIRPFQNVLIHSCAGGVGWAATQLARLQKGVKIFGTSSASKAKLAQENGVDYVFNYNEYKQKLNQLCPKGLNLILDNQAVDQFSSNIKFLAPFGKIVVLGINNVITNEKSLNLEQLSKGEANIPMTCLVMESISICGLHLGIVAEKYPETIQDYFNKICQLLRSKEIKIKIDSLWCLDDVKKATEQLQERRNIGKILLYTENAVNKKMI